MTRKDFELIAQVIRAARSYLGPIEQRELALDFAEVLANTNGRFDRERFIAACTR